MAYSLANASACDRKRAAASSSVTPKTHTPGSPLQKPGLRFYSANLSRWLSRDPISEEGRMAVAKRSSKMPDENLYAAFKNRPQDRHDILGLITLADYWAWMIEDKCWRCGPIIPVAMLRDVKTRMQNQYNIMKTTDSDRAKRACDVFDFDPLSPASYENVFTAISGWEITGLAYRQIIVRDPATGAGVCPFGRGCVETVEVDGKCHWQWAVNYLAYGWLNKICGISKNKMTTIITVYKSAKGTLGAAARYGYFGTITDLTQLNASKAFAIAAYDGWPDGGSIPDETTYRKCGRCLDSSCYPWSLAPSWPQAVPNPTSQGPPSP